MPVSVRRLMAYYRSPAFAEDYEYLVRYDPLAAQQQRYAIIGKFSDNMEAVGITPSRTELEVQERFLAGDLTLTELLAYVELYVESIALRWPS